MQTDNRLSKLISIVRETEAPEEAVTERTHEKSLEQMDTFLLNTTDMKPEKRYAKFMRNMEDWNISSENRDEIYETCLLYTSPSPRDS